MNGLEFAQKVMKNLESLELTMPEVQIKELKHVEYTDAKKSVESKKDEAGRTIYSTVITKEVEDRDGEIVAIDGMNLEPYMKNPVVLGFHDRHSYPIAKAINIYTEELDGIKQMCMDFVFAPTEEGEKAETLWKEGFMNTVSIGFMYAEQEGNILKGIELMEVSLVPVPSNREASRKEAQKAVDPEELDDVYKKYKESVNMSESELTKWSQNECSDLAGLDRAPIARNLRLLGKKKSEWNSKDITDANKTISFIARMKANLGGEDSQTTEDGTECGTKAYISLKNWAYDAAKDNLPTGKGVKSDNIETSLVESLRLKFAAKDIAKKVINS